MARRQMRSLAGLRPLPVWAGQFTTKKRVNNVAVAYEWVFNPLDVKLSEDGLTNVVYNINWRLIGTDGNYAASVYGSCGVPAPAPDAFTPYNKITESQVQSWVEEALGADQVAAYKDGIAKNIELQKNPVNASLQPPWSN